MAGTKPVKQVIRDNRLFTLEVRLLNNPFSKAFAKKRPYISRTVQILGYQSLVKLHEIIFKAFDRDVPSMYEFQFGKGPKDKRGRRYVLRAVLGGPFEPTSGGKPAGTVEDTTIGSLDLKVGQTFGYWLDYADRWNHQVDVVAISKRTPEGKYPRVIHKVGESPPQYAEDE